MQKITFKIIGIAFLVLIVLNFFLFIFGRINGIVFWIVIVICAVVAYKVLPWLRTRAT